MSNIKKVFLNTQDKNPNELHSDCLLNLHKPIENCTGFRVCSAHSPLSSFTFNTHNNRLRFSKQLNSTFPNISKVVYSETNMSTGVYHEETALLPNAVYTSAQIGTALSGIAASNMSFNITGTSISGVYSAVGYERRVSLRAYTKDNKFTMSDYMNLPGNETLVASGAIVSVVFSTHTDFTNKIVFPPSPTEILLDKQTVYDEASLATYLSTLIPNTVFTFVQHKIKVQNNEGTYGLRLFQNDKLGLEFDELDFGGFTDIGAGASFQSTHVSDQSTHVMTYLGLSFFNNSICSKKESHASDIVCALHNSSGVHYGMYLVYNNGSDEILPMNTNQFNGVHVHLYDRDFKLIDDQSLPTHVELSIYCK